MATVLKNYGYKAHAIHDNSAAFYDRDLVFSQLGFDTFTTKRKYEHQEMDRKWMGKRSDS